MIFPYPSDSREKDPWDMSPRQRGLQRVVLGHGAAWCTWSGEPTKRWTLGIKGKQATPTAVPHSPLPPPLPIKVMNSRLHQLMDQGTLAPGDGVRYVDHAGGGAVYEATLDRHGNIICDGHPHPHPRLGGGATDPRGTAVLVFPSASHFVRHCTRLDSRPSSRHYGSLYINGVAWPNLFQGAQDKEQPNGAAPATHRRRPSRHLQPSEANGIQGGAEREEKGKGKVRGPLAHLFISHLSVTVMCTLAVG